MNEKPESKSKEPLDSANEAKTGLVLKNQPDIENNTNQEDSPILAENTKHNEETLRKLWIVSAICLVFMIIEMIGGYLASSIAIMSDAAHLLSDFLGFMISIVSIYISRRKATDKMSFGYHRAEVIGALVSVNIIWGLTIWLLYEASLRLIYNQPVNGFIMLVTAVIGFLFNVVMGLVLMSQGIDHNLHHHHDHEHDPQLSSGESDDSDHSHDHSKNAHSHNHDHHDHDHNLKNGDLNLKTNLKENLLDGKEKGHHHDHDHKHDHDHSHHDNDGHLNHSHSHGHDHPHGHSHGHSHENLNMKAALVHVIGDAVQNLGVVIAGAIIYYKPEYSIADPICTFIFSIIVVFTTTRILKDCLGVLMEGSPLDFEIETLRKDLKKITGVTEVHDLHVWSLSVGKLSLSCHMISDNPQLTLREASNLCRNKYKIKHSTIQVESSLEKIKHDCDHDMH